MSPGLVNGLNLEDNRPGFEDIHGRGWEEAVSHKVRAVGNGPPELGKVVRGCDQIEQRGGKVHVIHIIFQDVGKRRRSTLKVIISKLHWRGARWRKSVERCKS